MFFINPVLILLTILGASFPDFDCDFRRNRVLGLILVSGVLSLVLYVVGLPFYIGLCGMVLGLVFLFSSHRGFTHSLLGGFLLSFFICFILVYGSRFMDMVLLSYGVSFSFSLIVMILLFGFFILNKRIFPFFFIFLVLSSFFVSFSNVSFVYIFLALFVGFLSHIVLDCFSVSGVKVFYPVYNRKFHRKFGVFLLFVLVLFSVFHLLFLGNLLFGFLLG